MRQHERFRETQRRSRYSADLAEELQHRVHSAVDVILLDQSGLAPLDIPIVDARVGELGPYFEVEGDRIAADVLFALHARGHQLDVDWGEYSPVLGILNAAGIDPHSGERIATADPRDPDGTARGQ